MQVRGYDIGVCSWSLQPKDAADLISKVRQLGLEHVQLGLGMLLARESVSRADELARLRDSGLNLTAAAINFPGEDYSSIGVIRRTGGFVSDDQWPVRKEVALRAGELTAELGLKYITSHIGFVPASSDPSYTVMVERVREVAKGLARDGVDLLVETGPESASELLQFLNDLNCRNVAVNFDPANMILYGSGDPIESVAILNRRIRHVHLKDAVASSQPGVQWGKEVSFGTGQVGVESLLEALDEVEYAGVLCIERESGTDRMADVRQAIEALRRAESIEDIARAAGPGFSGGAV